MLTSHSLVFLDSNQWPRTRDHICGSCKDESSLNSDVMLNPRMMFKNWLNSFCLGNLEYVSVFIGSDLGTIGWWEGKGKQKLGIGLELGNKPTER